MKQLLRRAAQTYRARRDIRRALTSSSEPIISGALSSALKSSGLPQIEQRRHELLADHSTINLVDFGAGHHSHPGDSKGAFVQGVLSQIVAQASKAAPWALFLHHIIKATRPESAIEMGSCVGISAAYIASALKANGAGKLYTLEGDPTLAEVTRKTLQKCGLDTVSEVVTGPFHDTLDNVISLAKPVGFAFIDGHHDGDATVRYFEQISPSLSPNAIVVFDDITWSPSMESGWLRIQKLKNVKSAINLGAVGVVVTH